MNLLHNSGHALAVERAVSLMLQVIVGVTPDEGDDYLTGKAFRCGVQNIACGSIDNRRGVHATVLSFACFGSHSNTKRIISRNTSE